MTRRRMIMIGHSLPRKREQGFTLIELLVVMAITVILLGLIFGPLVQGFNLTNRARVQIETQDVARRVMEIVSRDMGAGVFVFDNTGEPINLWTRTPDANGDPRGPHVVTGLPFGMMDLVPPARIIDQDANVPLINIDPTTGLPLRGDPSVNPRFNLSLPLAPGRTIVRYFLGLRDNTSEVDPTSLTSGRAVKPYANYYDNTAITTLNNHNPVILYRVVVSPYLPDGGVDERFFAKDSRGRPVLYDPNFFYDFTNPPDTYVDGNGNTQSFPRIPGYTGPNARGYGRRYENWKLISRAIVPTDRADEIVVERGGNGKPIYYPDPVNGPYMKITALARLQPTYVGNDAGAASSTKDPGNESPDVLPSTHRETYGHWTTPHRVYVYRNRLNTNPLPVFFWLNTGFIDDEVMEQLIDTTQTPPAVTSNQEAYWYPNWRPLLLDPTTGRQIPPPSSGKAVPGDVPHIMFTVDARKGIVNYAFPDSLMLHDAAGNPLPSQFDPAVINATYDTYVATNDPSNAIRYVSLKALPNGRVSPLSVIPNVRIVPGSEVVRGPDMKPGPHFGMEVTYTRHQRLDDVSSIGPNEYMINYTDDPYINASEPDVMKLARMQAGTVIFSSRDRSAQPGVQTELPTVDANGNPAAPITITYQMQNNQSIFSVRADYLTRELMTFSLGVRLYEFNSGQPQQVTLTRKVKVPNLQR